MMKLFLAIFFLFFGTTFAQPSVDSLIGSLKNLKEDTNRLDVYLKLAEFHPDEKEWHKYNELAFSLATKLSESSNEKISNRAKFGLASALNNKGYIELNNHNELKALSFFEKALFIKKQNPNKKGLADVYTNMGAVMDKLGKLEKAIEYYLLALNLKETQNSAILRATILGNIGNVYNTLGKHDKALEYFKEDLMLNTEKNYLPGISKTCSNISVIYGHLNNYSLAFKYAYKALGVSKQINDPFLECQAYSRLSDFYSDMKEYDSSYIYSNKCLALGKQQGDYIIIAAEFSNLGYINFMKKKYAEAETLFLRSYKIYDSISGLYGKKTVSRQLSDVYDSIKDYKKALFYYKINTQIKDSFFKDENKNALIKQGLQMEFDNKEAVLKEQQDKERIITEEKSQKQRIIIWAVFGGLVLVIVFSIFILNRLQVTRKQKILIEKQKAEVEFQKDIIAEQKNLVDIKQHEIISSINYAQRIQNAVLTGSEVWKKISKEYFIVFQPRDIVSGDFYWAHTLPNGRAIFALADCTGHGVPGGFMSMLGNSFLNEIVVENKLFKADEILNRLREKVINALEQKGQQQQKDGMDMALCVWNKMDNTIEFAGANNALYLVRAKHLTEYKGDKMPIGTYLEENKKFSAQKISLIPGDMIYLSTDGFADQFGGEKGKRFRSKQLEELLVVISDKSIVEQKNVISQTFFAWKNEQTDDVSLIGIKIT